MIPLLPPEQFDAEILDQPGSVLLDDRAPGQHCGTSYVLSDPRETIIAETAAEVPRALTCLDEQLRRGCFVAGFLAYDAGLELDKPIGSRHPLAGPLVWLGVYDQCRAFAAEQIDLGPPTPCSDIARLRLGIAEDQYLAAVQRVKQYIAAGDVYQINFTCKLRFENAGPARGLFSRLRRAHPVCHSAWINMGRRQVISLSPELFLRRTGAEVRTRPMKGTLRRGRWWEEDETLARSLPADEKNRAENVMIVDLMRNDLGRLCRPGTVQVAEALRVERYQTLFQMCSEVVGHLRDGVSTEQLLRATFPPGSVTGAPKLRAIEIIDELEHEARGVYCGAIGLFRPGGDCLLNVAIRTIVQQDGQCELGIGSGIVADSDPRAEWAEIWLKSRFLHAEHQAFELLETLLLPAGRPAMFLEEHLARLGRSAAYFGWEFPEARLRAAVERAAAEASGDCRLRLLLGDGGQCRAESSPVDRTPPEPVKALLAPRRTDPADVLLYHKTTARTAYDADWRDARRQGYFDLVYRNLDGRVTEGAITNLIAEIHGQWYTPPVECGLLPGIWRAAKLAEGRLRQRAMTLADLLGATRIVLGNSVRGDVELDALFEPGCDEPLWRRIASEGQQ